MLRELGPPSLFLTLSCAEYASADIEEYLRKVNDLPPSYNIGKLCTEDPISVSIKFSAMFHAFFKIFIKGGALGKVDHYYQEGESSSGSTTLPLPIVDPRCSSFWCGPTREGVGMDREENHMLNSRQRQRARVIRPSDPVPNAQV